MVKSGTAGQGHSSLCRPAMPLEQAKAYGSISHVCNTLALQGRRVRVRAKLCSSVSSCAPAELPDGFLPATRSEPACSSSSSSSSCGVGVGVAGWEEHEGQRDQPASTTAADKRRRRSKAVEFRAHGSGHEERAA
jgi:hypothetical protein